MKCYTAVIERDATDGVWTAHLAEEPRVHTFGRTIDAAREHIQDAANLWFDHEVRLHHRIELGNDANLVEEVGEARSAAETAHDHSSGITRRAVIVLTKNGYSRRDVATLLKISHQRVQQLLRG
jgi:predicted RNase H-like HicB family nuclease